MSTAGSRIRGRRVHSSAVIRVGVIVCVVLVVVAGIPEVYYALGALDRSANRAASRSYAERTLLPDGALGSGRVVEDARLWMPRDARYRVVVGTDGSNDWTSARYFLLGYLFPRRQVADGSAEWVFCYECDRTRLGGRFVLLSSSPSVTFGRLER